MEEEGELPGLMIEEMMESASVVKWTMMKMMVEMEMKGVVRDIKSLILNPW